MDYKTELNQIMALELAQQTISTLIGIKTNECMMADASGHHTAAAALDEEITRLYQESKAMHDPDVINKINEQYAPIVRQCLRQHG